MLIVADTGPLITLVQIDQLRILEILYPDYVLPDLVFEELNRYKPVQQFSESLRQLENHIKKPRELLPPVQGLDDGELACLSLYYELKADAVLIEDKTARNWAESQGISCFGSIALLVKAKREGLIGEIKPFLLEMRKKKRYISDELYFKTLSDEGENT